MSKQRGIASAVLIGVIWGLGHTLTIFVVGAAIILFKVEIPTRLGLSMELSVGLMLILLGLLNLTGVLQRVMTKLGLNPTPVQVIEAKQYTPTALVPSEDSVSTDLVTASTKNKRKSIGFFNLLRPLIIGIVHGLAGSAAVALLVMTTISDPWRELVYLLVFGFGTVAGMTLITAVIAMPFAYTARRFSGWNHGMAVASGVVSLCFGMVIFYQTGIAGGLFTAHPHWIPR
jgi:high-affinity nickel-transport protein